MDYQQIFALARDRPGMLGLDGSFVAAAAFVNGCDAGNSWRLLDGFSEWLAVLLGDGANLSWHTLVVRHAQVDPRKFLKSNSFSADDNAVAVETLFLLLQEFWEVREHKGLSSIFGRYAELFE